MLVFRGMCPILNRAKRIFDVMAKGPKRSLRKLCRRTVTADCICHTQMLLWMPGLIEKLIRFLNVE